MEISDENSTDKTTLVELRDSRDEDLSLLSQGFLFGMSVKAMADFVTFDMSDNFSAQFSNFLATEIAPIGIDFEREHAYLSDLHWADLNWSVHQYLDLSRFRGLEDDSLLQCVSFAGKLGFLRAFILKKMETLSRPGGVEEAKRPALLGYYQAMLAEINRALPLPT